MKRNAKEEPIMGEYEAKLMKQLDEEEAKMERRARSRKGFHISGSGCYSTKGPYVDDEYE